MALPAARGGKSDFLGFSVYAANRKITTLLFDWDGTLLDSADRSFLAFEKALREFGIILTSEAYANCYAPNWYTMYEALNLPTECWHQANELWIQHYGQESSELVPDARETLLSLGRKGYSLGIVTSGTRVRVTREIDELNLSSVFEVVVGSEDVENKKPHPEGLEKAMALLNAEKRSCSYIGDAPEDIQMGKNAEVLTVAVPSSFPTSRHLAKAQPDIHVASIKEVLLHF